jgi:8-oxo-dGTP pyrophosphatase MutT (NUDIX family)
VDEGRVAVRRFTDESFVRLLELLRQRRAVEIVAPQHRRACVLIPLIRSEEGEWRILFSKRSDQLTAHSGQIAFPGGSVEPGESLETAAVREPEEEVGIPRELVELIGRLDDVITHSGFLVAPFVGRLASRVEYVLQESEVTEVFEVPIDALLDAANPEVRWVPFKSRQFPAYFYRYQHYEIWGLTGRMLKGFLDLVWTAL